MVPQLTVIFLSHKSGSGFLDSFRCYLVDEISKTIVSEPRLITILPDRPSPKHKDKYTVIGQRKASLLSFF